MKCIKCGKPVLDKEWQERYDELVKVGIVPLLIPMCKECRKGK